MKNKKNIKRILTAILVIMIIAGLYVGAQLYRSHLEGLEREEELEMESEAEIEMIRQGILDRIAYSDRMFFQNSFDYNDRISDSMMPVYWSFYHGDIDISEVVFVSSAEEVEGFAEDVFVAWPTEGSEMFLDFINGWLDPEDRGMLQHVDMVIDIDDLNIELPLPQDLMVEDWETMREIRRRLGRDGDETLRSIVEGELRDAERFGEETNED